MSNERDATNQEALDAEAPAVPSTGDAAAADATAEAAATADAEAQVPVPVPVEPVVIDAAPAISPARRRSLVVLAGLSRVVRFALVVAVFVAGIALGYRAFVVSQPLPTGASADPAIAGGEPPPVVREFIAAVGSNDADSIRSAVPADPYKSFTSEMSRWEFQEVTSVETLATFVDGPRSATAFMMIGRDNAGNPIAINLVVETQAGAIVGFK